MEPKGSSGTGLCKAETGYCSSKTGFIKKETGRWNHYNVIAGDHSSSKVNVSFLRLFPSCPRHIFLP